MSSSLQLRKLWRESLVWLTEAVLCLLAASTTVRCRRQWMAAQCAALSLTHVNQLPLLRL